MNRTFFKLLCLTILPACTALRGEEVTIRRVEITEPGSPIFQNEDGEETVQVRDMALDRNGERRWFRIAAEYSTEAEWTDALTVDFYVLLPGASRVIRGTARYLDIPAGRDHLSEMYLHFNSYARRYRRGKTEYAVIISANGKPLAVETSRQTPAEWWTKLPTDICRLLERNRTPFAIFSAGRHEAFEFGESR